jgi:hypothetical protein
MLMPLRGGPIALAITYDLDELVEAHPHLNPTLEETWASVLSVMAERWPDWPLEVWSRVAVGIKAAIDDTPSTPRYELSYRVFFGGEGPDVSDVVAMSNFLVQALAGLIQAAPELAWGTIDPAWRSLWAVDDGEVIRLIATERALGPSVYLVGHYAGEPTYFSAAVEAWPLSTARLPIKLVEADTAWAFGRS